MAVLGASVFLLLLGLSSAVKLDMCRVKHDFMQNFDLSQLEGEWFEYARLPNIIQYLQKQKCGVFDVSKEGNDDDEKTARFNYTWTNETLSPSQVTSTGNLTTAADKPGKVLVNLPAVGFNDYFGVLDAKYDDYAVFYSCDTVWYFRIELAWVLTRERSPSAEKKAVLVKKLKDLKIDTDRLEFVEQEKC